MAPAQPTRTPKPLVIGLLLMGSGMSALVYQVAWLQELRLIFGASTAATATVLAIFMGGLGAGGLILGRRVDRLRSPLGFYANLELAVSLAAAVSPFLLTFIRYIYIESGGILSLGITGATALRLGLTALVLGVPTFLMGGTLPAASRAVTGKSDVGRFSVAVLYGMNTLGAVLGAALATFYSLETFGTRSTLWLACTINVLVAIIARDRARKYASANDEPKGEVSPSADLATPRGTRDDLKKAPAAYVLGAAAVVGFAFLLMELVWYRMLSPILGGSTYTFGLILAIALFGIGIGSGIYSFVGFKRPATLTAFTLSVGLEALFIAIPYAAGDHVAILAFFLRDLSVYGFLGQVSGWAVVTTLVVLPPAIVSGFQFPLLIALLGSGRNNIGRQTGVAYASNTTGAVLGSLAGGFGALPFLSAPGAWRLSVYLLAVLGLLGILISLRHSTLRKAALAPTAALLLALILVQAARGPTSVWRHSGIGAGRAAWNTPSTNAFTQRLHEYRRKTIWEADGTESSIAIVASKAGGFSFFVNGKSDGNSTADAPTVVGLGMLPAILHPNPRNAFVVGLGTGTSAGWLAAIDSIESVDVAELEREVLEVAKRCATVNHDALNNPKLNVLFGDAREFLLTTTRNYDLIVSEPSNPYRAGIASMFTKEFYEAAGARLLEDGIFAQWVQGYEIDSETFRLIITTLHSVFPSVEIWQTQRADLLLVCSLSPIEFSVSQLEERLAKEPFASAFLNTWRITDVEGIFAHYVANASLADMISKQEGDRYNLDNQNLVEYGFARSVGKTTPNLSAQIRKAAVELKANRPPSIAQDLDWEAVNEQRAQIKAFEGMSGGRFDFKEDTDLSEDAQQRIEALRLMSQGNGQQGLDSWKKQPRAPRYPSEFAILAATAASLDTPDWSTYLDDLRAFYPTEADTLQAHKLAEQGKNEEAVELLIRVFADLKVNPWTLPFITQKSLDIAESILKVFPEAAARFLPLLEDPFAVYSFDSYRKLLALQCAREIGPEIAAEHFERFEPDTVWQLQFLKDRVEAYKAVNHPNAARAKRELAEYLAHAPVNFDEDFRARSVLQDESDIDVK